MIPGHPSDDWIDAVLRETGLSPSTVTPITTGWDFYIFELDGAWMLRVPRTDEAAQRMDAEGRLLTHLAPRVPFRVPLPLWAGVVDGRNYSVYAKVEGRAMRKSDSGAAVGSALAQLHCFPVREARELLEVDGSMSAWVREYERFWTAIVSSVLPLLPVDLKSKVQRLYLDTLATTAWNDITPVLIHRDLGAEHIRMSDDGSQVRGIIDFGDATVGDPAINFVGALITLGESGLAAAINAYGSEIARSRVDFYYWLGPVHEILYGLSLEDRSIIDSGVRGLHPRLHTPAAQPGTRP